MQWRREEGSREPVYRQIARFFEKQIRAGEMLPGALLPTERELADRFGINRSTVTAAYGELRASGLIQSTQGSGTRVSETVWGDAPKRGLNWHSYVSGGGFVPTLDIVRQARAAAAQPGVYRFSRGELSPCLMPASLMKETAEALTMTLAMGYEDPRGDLTAREQLAAHLKRRHGIRVRPDEVMLTNGAQQALHLIAQGLLRPGDAVGLEDPSYGYSRSLFVSAGLRLFQIPMDAQGLIPEEVAALDSRHKIRMIFINPTYQNPTGTTLPTERRKRLLEICRERRIPIVEDDPYSLLHAAGSEPAPPALKALDPGGDLVLYVGTLSKIAAPGLRLGWLVAPAGVIRRLAEAKGEMDYGTSPILQELAVRYLASGSFEAQTEAVRAGLARRRDRMLTALRAHLGGRAVWHAPKGGYYIWCSLKPRIRDEALVQAAAARGVSLMPSSVYGGENGSFRLSFANEPEERIAEGIRLLAEALDSLDTKTLPARRAQTP